MSIQGSVNKVLGSTAAAVIASPKVQAKLESKKTNKILEGEVKKATKIAEQTKVDLPKESLAARYPIGQSKEKREDIKINAATEIGKLQQSVKANDNLVKSLENVYNNNPSDTNLKNLMDAKAVQARNTIPLKNEISSIQNRLNYIEPDSIKKRKEARERAGRRLDAKRQEQQDLLDFISKNKSKSTDLNASQKALLIDAINQGGKR